MKAVYEAVKDVFPTAGYAYVSPAAASIDTPETLVEYRRLVDEAALATMVAASRRAA